MTIPCKTDTQRPSPGRYRFNPFEVAVTGQSNAVQRVVAAQLKADLARERCVCEISGPGESLRPRDARVSVDAEGHIAEDRIDYSAGILPPQAALDADCVVAFGTTGHGLPALHCIDGNSKIDVPEGALACIGPKSACPVLPAGISYLPFEDRAAILQVVQAHFMDRVAGRPLYGLVLAGGKSTRMGQDKGALQYHDVPQTQHMAELLSGHCDRVYVSVRPDQTSDAHVSGLPQIADRFTGIGPMGGILSALFEAPDAAWFVVGCDLPFLEESAIDLLKRARNPYRCATAFRGFQDLPEPLCAIYEPKSVHYLMAFLARGYQCPRKVLINSPSEIIAPADPQALANVNRPEEYDAALSALRETRREVG